MRLSETKIAANGSGVTHTNVRDVLLQFHQRGQLIPQNRGTLQLMMSTQRADLDGSVLGADFIQPLDAFNIDEMLVLNQSLFLANSSSVSPA